MVDPLAYITKQVHDQMRAICPPTEHSWFDALYNWDNGMKLYILRQSINVFTRGRLSALYHQASQPRAVAAVEAAQEAPRRRKKKHRTHTAPVEEPAPVEEAPAPRRRKRHRTHTEQAPAPEPEPEAPRKKRRKILVADIAKEDKEKKKVWTKLIKRRKELENHTNRYIHGLQAGIMEDKRINKTEAPAWAAANRVLSARNVEQLTKAGKAKPRLPHMTKEEIEKLEQELENEPENEQPVRKRTRKQAANGEARPPPRRRQKKTLDEKETAWKNNWEKFKNDINLALCNSSIRFEMCRWIEKEGQGKHKAWAETKGIDWKHWYETPVNPKNNVPYKQNNNIQKVLANNNTTLEAEKERARRLYG